MSLYISLNIIPKLAKNIKIVYNKFRSHLKYYIIVKVLFHLFKNVIKPVEIFFSQFHYERSITMLKHKGSPRLMSAGIAIAMMISVTAPVLPSYASTQDNLNAANQKVTDLQDTKSGLESTLSGLNSELQSISDEISGIETQISDKNQEIADTEASLETAIATEDKQYEDMKLRIKYTYENGSSSYLAALLESRDMAELMNRADQVQTLNTYDRNMLTQYIQTKETIADSKDKLVSERNDLSGLQASLSQKKSDASAKIAETSTSISRYSEQIQTAENDAAQYEATLNAEKAAAAAAAATTSSSSSRVTNVSSGSSSSSSGSSSSSSSSNASYDASDSDLNMLAAIIYCEAGDQSYEGKVAVGAVVMNRVRSSSFPNTISGVIYQSGQFTPVRSGRFALALATQNYGSCISAAQEALSGTDNVGGRLFFCMNTGSIDGLIIGDHVFY